MILIVSYWYIRGRAGFEVNNAAAAAVCSDTEECARGCKSTCDELYIYIYIYSMYNTIATTLLPPRGVAAAAPAGKGRNTGRGRKFTGWANCALSRSVWVCVLAYSIYLCAALHINCYTYIRAYL